ncbi:hypothetical protein KIK84_07105 [Curvibacter sp. CHRR-16]|uniref:HD-GYP domain-containing protein n=1 Tax=Curvibacter sp. CHRR-16 TaxID=2835872 RepID=UPI001BD938E5|nr:hypothetical protein [Curvibacter sp. CHRR-16]MBT0570086.1 hypothetical protein [Curvibacter sp. CHRR-16]
MPVDIWSETGQLLLRKGQPIVSEQHRDKLHAFNASAIESDAMAWQHAYERQVYQMVRDGVDVQAVAQVTMPKTISQLDYVRVKATSCYQGGWLDIQEVLRGILYQGGLAIRPARRLKELSKHAVSLLSKDPDDSLYCLFQLLADETVGYCATNALLCACISLLAARKLGLDEHSCEVVFDACLTMNIGMAREQDSMTRQTTSLTDEQRELIAQHGERGMQILSALGVDEPDWLDLVRWHQKPSIPNDKPSLAVLRQILHTADVFVAKVAARKTRLPLSSLHAVKAIYTGGADAASPVGAAITNVLGFYPPGTYVRMSNGDTAVVAQRGIKVNLPWLISIQNEHALPVQMYQCRQPQEGFTIVEPITFASVKLAISHNKVRRARERVQHLSHPY